MKTWFPIVVSPGTVTADTSNSDSRTLIPAQPRLILTDEKFHPLSPSLSFKLKMNLVRSVSAELATVARKTRGVVPPKLVGASTTVIGDKMYLFGGRLVVERRMLNDVYVFDMQSYTWDKLEPPADGVVPGPRYFHSADTWNNNLVIFGGMGYQTESQTPESLCVLNDVWFFSITEGRWTFLEDTPTSPDTTQSLAPRARYAHLSSISSDLLFIIGGQDISNGWLDDIHIFDLPSRKWVHCSDYPRHCGTYRSIALSSPLIVRNPSFEPSPPPACRFRPEDTPSVLPVTPPDSFVELPFSSPPTASFPSQIYLYSNYNFTDVKRELEVFTPQSSSSFIVADRSNAMTGDVRPPGLRFPTGALLGTSLIIAGTYLAHSYQAFSIWSLDLTTMAWSHIEPGTALASGSWCRAVLWRESNKFLVFGNREGNLVEDYNHRLLSWDHVAYIDLEAFGVYQPPNPGYGLGREAQAMGLAALEDGAFADFEIICDDGRRVSCSRKLLEDRWPWFRDQRRRYLAAASTTVDTTGTNPVSSLPIWPPSSDPILPRPDPRLTPRSLHLAEPYPITIAFLQYLYAQALLTPLQHAPAVLSALLLLSSTYEIPHLRDLVKHAMHKALTTGSQGVSGVYDVATLCDCQSLRIRAMRMFKNGRRPTNRSRSDRPEHERHGGSGGSQGRGSSGGPPAGRPRGFSESNQSQAGSSSFGGDLGQGLANGHSSGASILKRDTSLPPNLLRRPSHKSLYGPLSDLEPVEEIPPPHGAAVHYSASISSFTSISSMIASHSDDDDDSYDLDLLGLDLSSGRNNWTPVPLGTQPYRRKASMSSLGVSEDYFYGTDQDSSPISTSFPAPDKIMNFHLPYSIKHRPSRSASFSDSPSLTDTPSMTESISSGTLSTSSINSSAPVTPHTPLTPALAEIVDAVAKVHPSRPGLSRQTSLRSIDEGDLGGITADSESEKNLSLAHFPNPPPTVPRKTLTVKTSLSHISEVDGMRSPNWLSRTPSRSPGLTSGFDTPTTPSATTSRSISRKSSYDVLSSDRRTTTTTTPVPQIGATISRLLYSRRSSSALDREAAKGRLKLETKVDEGFGSAAPSVAPEKDSLRTGILSGLWSPRSPRGKTGEKKKKKEAEKQKIQGLTEMARQRVDSRGFEGLVVEKIVIAGVGDI